MIFTLQLLFVIFLFAQTYQYRKAWYYICYTLIVVQSKPTADWNVDKQFTSDTNFAKVSEKTKTDYLSGVTKRAHKPPPPPHPQKTSFISQTRNFFLLSFFPQVIIRQLKFESSRTSTKLNFYEIFKWMTEISILHAITQMYGDVWKLLLTSVEDKNALFRTKRTKNKSFPWIINKLLREIYKGDFLKRKATSSNDPLIGKQFKDERNKTNNAIKKAKRKYFSEILDANKGDPHKTWRFINEFQSPQK